MMKNVFFINPHACADKLEKVKKHIAEAMDGRIYEIVESTHAGQLTELARERHDCIIYSVGGDGTLIEVVDGMAETDNAVCVIPAGSGNDFSRMLTDEKDYVKVLSESRGYGVRKTDCGKADGHYFANIASIGYDAEVVLNAAKFKKTPVLRRISYIVSVFYTLFTYKGIKAKITVDDEVYDGRFLLAAFANGQYYGGGIHIAPTAELNDGFLDVYLIDEMTMFKLFTLLPKLTTGSHTRYKSVHIIRAKHIKIESETPFVLNLDGELYDKDGVKIDIVENGLNVFY